MNTDSRATVGTARVEQNGPEGAVGGDPLRALIRLIPPAWALRDELQRSIDLQLYEGTGDLAMQSFEGLRASVVRLTNDPYVAALSPQPREDANDKQKIALVLMAVGQLVAYLEGQTGWGWSGKAGSRSGDRAVNNRPVGITIHGPVLGLSPETTDKLVNFADKLAGRIIDVGSKTAKGREAMEQVAGAVSRAVADQNEAAEKPLEGGTPVERQ